MATLKDLQQRVLALQGNEVALAVESFNDNEKAFLKLNKSQLAQGLQKDDNESTFVYKPFTIAQKKQRTGLASVTDHLTNFDTGESYKKMYVNATADNVIIGTTSGLEDDISGRMKGKAFGLNSDNSDKFVKENLQKTYVEKVRKQLNL
jgi:hypothetical protein